jgi:mono/diheme cytochrome c family protein
MEKRGIVLVAGVLLVALSAAASADSVDSGRMLFAEHCAGCHGAEGKGGGVGIRMFAALRGGHAPLDLTEGSAMRDWSRERVVAVIAGGGKAAGLSAAMPAYSSSLSPQEIDDLAAYVAGLQR